MSDQLENWFKSLSPAQVGALWGAGLFFCLWIGMFGTLGEILLVIPALFVPGTILSIFGVVISWESVLWRLVGAALSAVGFVIVGSRYGFAIQSMFEKLPKTTRRIVSGLLLAMVLLIILVGRNLRVH